MFEQAIVLVSTYNAMVLVAIAATGVATATAWSLAVKQRKSQGQ